MNYLKPFWVTLAIIIAAMLIFTLPSFSGLSDLDLEDQRQVSVIVTQTNLARTLGGLLILPINQINGGLALQGLHVSHDGDTISDSLLYRIQGGPLYNNVSLQFFVEGELDRYLDRGIFVRPGVINIDGWRLSGGAGVNWRGQHADIAPDADESLLLNPFIFASLDRGNWSVLARYLPGHDFLIEPRFTTEVGRVNITINAKFGYQLGEPIRQGLGQIDIPF